MLRSRDAQLKAGKSEDQVMILAPKVAFTLEPQRSEGQIVMVPVCLEHLNYKTGGLLTS